MTSFMPYYLSFLPFCAFHLWSGEAHVHFSLLWFISVVLVALQSGNPMLDRHVLIFGGLFLGKHHLHY